MESVLSWNVNEPVTVVKMESNGDVIYGVVNHTIISTNKGVPRVMKRSGRNWDHVTNSAIEL